MPNAILVGVCLPHETFEDKEHSLDELERLADTAEIATVGKAIQKRTKIDNALYVGTGFLKSLEEKMTVTGAEVLIFDTSLSPRQGRNMQERFGIEAVDRTEIILQVFHNHARTPESRLQVRLAELEYQLPRLKALWSHLDRQRGSSRSGGPSGGDAQRGGGEKQIEIDRRLIEREIRAIKKKLEKIDVQTAIAGKRRADRKKVCLVGHTNAGKSTLFNQLTDAAVLVEDKLFATLDSTARPLYLGKGKGVILSDTVGFISGLPHHLVASFRATLKEVVDADLLLHVVDLSDELWEQHIEAAEAVLRDIGAAKIPQLFAFNKIDRMPKGAPINGINGPKYGNSVLVSARKGRHCDLLIEQLDNMLHESQQVELVIPFSEPKVIDWLHRFSDIQSKEFAENGIKITAIVNEEDLRFVERYRRRL